jgi:hypothetical protein
MQRKLGSPEAAIDYKLWPFGTSMAFPTMCIEPVNYRDQRPCSPIGSADAIASTGRSASSAKDRLKKKDGIETVPPNAVG